MPVPSWNNENDKDGILVKDEAGRLAALHHYKILDTPQEPAFDRIVTLAALLLDVPIALISLIDSDRQWFKAAIGLDVKETPRCIAFCDHAIRGRDLFIVPDAWEDPRFAANVLVTEYPHLRFYAGVPLVTADGYALGTLCALDRAPRQMTERDSIVLKELAGQVMHEIDVRAALGDLYNQVDRNRHAERALRSTNLQLAALLNATGNAVFAANADRRITTWNRAAEAMFGYTPDEIAGLPLARLLSETGREETAEYLSHDPAEQSECSQSPGSQPRELHGRHKDGHEFPIEVSLATWPETSGSTTFAGIIRDVTDQSRRSATEREREKLAALGELAGGVAHELNNLLQPVLSLSQLAYDSLAQDIISPAEQIEIRDDINGVIEYTRQTREIVRKILLFARRDIPTLETIDLPTHLRESVGFIRDLLPPAITINVAIDPAACGLAMINTVELTQLITNLAVNAVHAMEGRGSLTVGLNTKTIDETEFASLDLPAAHYFALSITDTGWGMTDTVKARIFEPFFTTKPIGQGTGLGLSVAHGILRSWKGSISVESSPGLGSTFTLMIPKVLTS